MDTAQGLQPWDNISGMKNCLAFSSAKPFVQRGKCHGEFSFQGNVWAALCKQILQSREGTLGKGPSLCLQQTEAKLHLFRGR